MDGQTAAPETPPILVHGAGRIHYANEAALALFDCDGVDALVGSSIFDFVADRHRDAMAEGFEHIAAGTQPSAGHTIELTTGTPGSNVMIALSTPVGWDGEDRIQTQFFDIDSQLSPSLSAYTMDETPTGISVADATHEDEPLIYVNDEFVELTGYPREEIVGRNCRFLQGEGTREETVAEIRAAIDAEEPITAELRNYREDGSMFWNRLSIKPVRDETGTVRHFLGFQEDITDEKLYEQERTLFELQANAIEQAVFITDAEGTIEFVNPAFERMTGYTAREAIGENPRLLKSDEQDEGFYSELWETITAGEVWDAEIVNQRKSGERYQVKQKVIPITDDRGDITHFVAIEEDVTDAQFIEEVLSVMDRVLRHNVRNSVTAIAGNADLLDGELDDAEHSAAVETIREQAKQLEALSNETRTIRELFHRRQAQHSLSVGAIEGFVKARREQHPDADIRLEMNVDPDLEIQNGSLLQLAIDEAIENAIVHNDRETPRVTVRVDRAESDPELLIEIDDDGPGIPEDQWRVITAGAETAVAHSTGIGLWLIYWTVTALGGTVSRADNDSQGTTLTYRIPLGTGSHVERWSDGEWL